MDILWKRRSRVILLLLMFLTLPLLMCGCDAGSGGGGGGNTKDGQIHRLQQQLDETKTELSKAHDEVSKAHGEIKKLSEEHGAKTTSLYTWLTVAIVAGVIGFFVAVAIGSSTRQEHEQTIQNSNHGGGDERTEPSA